jgi:hypothetical protein
MNLRPFSDHQRDLFVSVDGPSVLRVKVNRQPPEQSAALICDRLMTFFAPAVG